MPEHGCESNYGDLLLDSPKQEAGNITNTLAQEHGATTNGTATQLPLLLLRFINHQLRFFSLATNDGNAAQNGGLHRGHTRATAMRKHPVKASMA